MNTDVILIRADANEQIGTGHVMRCISIAQAFKERGVQVIFVTADHRADQLLSGFETISLSSDWKDMESELDRFLKIIRKYHPLWLVVDSYYVTELYFSVLSKAAKTAYIDDLNTFCLDVSCLINYNIFAEEFDYSAYKKKNCRLLLMPQYAPLRQDFRDLPGYKLNKDVTDIFVSAGGTDPEGITEKIIEMICDRMADVTFHFVIGALNPRITKIKNLKKKNVVFHVDEQHMPRLMQTCDMAVSAAGTTLYELCACGIPTITYALADNQLLAAEAFSKNGIMVNVGDCRQNEQFMGTLSECICNLRTDYEKRKDLSKSMRRMVDGNGAKRIVEELLTN